MIIDSLKKVWDFVNNMNSQVKTLIILILMVLWGYSYIMKQNQEIITNYIEHLEK